MWEKLYYLDVSTILTLMAIGALIGFMLGRRLMDGRMLTIVTIVFLIASFIFLDTHQPEDMPEKPQPKQEATEALEDMEPASGSAKLLIESNNKE